MLPTHHSPSHINTSGDYYQELEMFHVTWYAFNFNFASSDFLNVLTLFLLVSLKFLSCRAWKHPAGNRAPEVSWRKPGSFRVRFIKQIISKGVGRVFGSSSFVRAWVQLQEWMMWLASLLVKKMRYFFSTLTGSKSHLGINLWRTVKSIKIPPTWNLY